MEENWLSIGNDDGLKAGLMADSLPFHSIYIFKEDPNMTVRIEKAKKSLFSEEYCYMTKRAAELSDEKFYLIDKYVEIPERFSPAVTPEGTITVRCDGVGYLLREVLGMDHEGNPALVYPDPKLGYTHRVRLEEV